MSSPLAHRTMKEIRSLRRTTLSGWKPDRRATRLSLRHGARPPPVVGRAFLPAGGPGGQECPPHNWKAIGSSPKWTVLDLRGEQGAVAMFDPQRIRRARQAAGLSQRALGEQIGKKTDTVRGYEKGRIEPPGSVVERIAAATGKPATWFVRGETVRPATSADEGVRAPKRLSRDSTANKGQSQRPTPHFGIGSKAQRRGRAVASYDPDEPPIPGGLQRLIDMGLPLRQDELEELVAFADPLSKERGAHGAMGWTPGQWLDVLLEERRRTKG